MSFINDQNSDFQIDLEDITSKLDMNYYQTDYAPSIFLFRTGNVVYIEVFIHTKELTGSDIIFPEGSIPSRYRPTSTRACILSCRNSGTWASASFKTCILRVNANGSAELATGESGGNSGYFVSGFASWLRGNSN